MTVSFVAFQSMSVARKEDFADTSLIPEVFGRHIVSRCLPPERHPVLCSASAEPTAGSGIRLRFSSRIGNLTGSATIAHKFFFVDREETRERLHVVTPDEPENPALGTVLGTALSQLGEVDAARVDVAAGARAGISTLELLMLRYIVWVLPHCLLHRPAGSRRPIYKRPAVTANRRAGTRPRYPSGRAAGFPPRRTRPIAARRSPRR